MKKRKRIKALPVCSEGLKDKCAIYQGCLSRKCNRETTCEAAERIEHQIDKYGEVIMLVNCRCAEYQYSGIGCPLFIKVGE